MDSLGEYLRHAFAVLERELAPEALRTSPRPSAQAMALGVIDPRRAHEVFHGTIEHVIVPGLEQRGIGARSAWRERSGGV